MLWVSTWTPIKDLVVVFHPLNYNFVFSDSDFDFQSSGTKIVADYTRQLTKGVAWKSNLSAFSVTMVLTCLTGHG
ncbi:MAG: hypothetical protein R2795_12955 [Saprospiraceae bacterium]